MNYYIKAVSFTCIFALCAMGQTFAPVPGSPAQPPTQLRVTKKDQALRISQEAFANPFSEDKVKAYMSSLPRDADLFIVEGDLLLTEQELRAYLVVKSQSEKPVESSAELLVNVHNGQRDYYAEIARRTLTYAIDKQSFPKPELYATATEHMKRATAEWEAACPECKIKFEHVASADAQASTERVNFVVRFRDVNGAYIAAAFFPHDGPGRRYLNIDPSYFTTSFDKAGVLRHELGHVLGYRHEHIRGIAGCFSEDNSWQPLTDYDPKSVMHYFCGGAGSLNLQLTDIDKAGHRKLYSVPNVVVQPRNLRIRFEGPDLAKSLPQVLDKLGQIGVIETKTYTVKANGETLRSVYASTLQLPSQIISNSMVSYANSLNRGTSTKSLAPGQEILYPNVRFKTFQKLLVLDPKVPTDVETYNRVWSTWPSILIKENKQETGTDSVSLSLKGYELNVQTDSLEEDNQARSALRDLRKETKANYLVLNAPRPTAPAALYSFPNNPVSLTSDSAPPLPTPEPGATTQEGFFEQAVATGELDAGVEGDLRLVFGTIEDLPLPEKCQSAQPENRCPQVVLMDTAVFLHPDIADAIKDGGNGSRGDPPINNNKQFVRVERGGDGILDSEHGTYMAGIIGSRKNNFGLIGVNPEAEIIAVDWDLAIRDPQQLADDIDLRQENSRNGSKKMQIFVFATEWRFTFPVNRPDERFDNSDPDRMDPMREIAKVIKNSRPLIIAAAGQPREATVNPMALRTTGLEGPRNMGDLENVIVVTTYKTVTNPDGTRGKPEIWDRSNIPEAGGPKIVHVAAPGLLIVSTVPNSGTMNSAPYGRASGTSQATAFVAGLVSAMVGAWPGYYTESDLVKVRLQLTSDPFIRGADAVKLAAGIVDYNLAMRNPQQHWFKANDDQTFVQIFEPRWLVKEIQLRNKLNQPIGQAIQTKKIFRIMFRDGDVYIYAKGGPGEVQKFGPGTLRTQDIGGLKLFELRRAVDAQPTQYSLSEMKDLVLHKQAAGPNGRVE